MLDDLDDAVRVAQRMADRAGSALTLGYVIGAGLELVFRWLHYRASRPSTRRYRGVEYDFADPTAGTARPRRWMPRSCDRRPAWPA